MTALVVLRDKVIKPLLASSCQRKRGPKPKNPTPLDAHYQQLQAGMRRDDFRVAAANLNEALRIHPSFAEAYFELGLIALEQGEMGKSISALEKAVRLDPQLV